MLYFSEDDQKSIVYRCSSRVGGLQRSDGHAVGAGVYARPDAGASADRYRNLGALADEFRDADQHSDCTPNGELYPDAYADGYGDANRYRYSDTNRDPLPDASSQ